MRRKKTTYSGFTDEKLLSIFSCSGDCSVLNFHLDFMVTDFEDLLDSLQQGPFQPVRPVMETTDTSGVKLMCTRERKKSCQGELTE